MKRRFDVAAVFHMISYQFQLDYCMTEIADLSTWLGMIMNKQVRVLNS